MYHVRAHIQLTLRGDWQFYQKPASSIMDGEQHSTAHTATYTIHFKKECKYCSYNRVKCVQIKRKTDDKSIDHVKITELTYMYFHTLFHQLFQISVCLVVFSRSIKSILLGFTQVRTHRGSLLKYRWSSHTY